jgi:pSer/pThr/pTyr-binding forkhead associated (FHA) protein
MAEAQMNASGQLATGRRVLVEGRGGLVEGVKVALRQGVPLAVGRSRSCDLSFRRAAGFRRRPDREQLLRSREFNRLSRVHCELTLMADGRVEVLDLSHNGTWVDGDRVQGTKIVDLRHGAVHVDPLLGAFGSLLLRPE